MAKNLQFLRSSQVFQDKETAWIALSNKTLNDACDGTPILAKYTDENGDIKMLLGLIHEDLSGQSMTILEEPSEIKEELAKLKVYSSDNTILVGEADENGTDIKVNVDGVTISADTDGVISAIIPDVVEYEGSDAIAVSEEAEGVKTISLTLKDDEGVLSQDADGLKTTLSISYDSDSKMVQLFGIDQDTPISEFDATDFIKDAFLSGATYDETTHTLTLSWNTEAGIQDTDIDLSDLVDIYEVIGTEKQIKVETATTGSQQTFTVSLADDFEYVENINVNGVSGTVTDHVAEVEINSSDIKIGDDYVEVTYHESFSGDDVQKVAIDDSETEAFEKVESTIGALVDRVVEHEVVVSDAIEALATAAGTLTENDEIQYIQNTEATYISGATSLADADSLLDAAIKELSEKTPDGVAVEGSDCVEVESSEKTVEGVKTTTYTVKLNHANDGEEGAGLYDVTEDDKTKLDVSFDFGTW